MINMNNVNKIILKVNLISDHFLWLDFGHDFKSVKLSWFWFWFEIISNMILPNTEITLRATCMGKRSVSALLLAIRPTIRTYLWFSIFMAEQYSNLSLHAHIGLLNTLSTLLLRMFWLHCNMNCTPQYHTNLPWILDANKVKLNFWP